MNTYEEIYAVVRQIPLGKVATYGQIAHFIGRSRHARLVGYALHQVDFQESAVPWHRVINAKGEVSYSVLRRGSDYLQRTLLAGQWEVLSLAGRSQEKGTRPDLKGPSCPKMVEIKRFNQDYYGTLPVKVIISRRCLCLKESAFSLDTLCVHPGKWLSHQANLYRLKGQRVYVGDGIKVAKEGRKMPGVKRLHQESENMSKPEWIRGHYFNALSVLPLSRNGVFCHPPHPKASGWPQR